MENNISEYRVLEQLFEYAKKLGLPGDDILTAEKFMLAVTNALTGEFVPEYTEPAQEDAIQCLSAFFEYYQISLKFAKRHLQNHIGIVGTTSEDNSFMKGLLDLAQLSGANYDFEYLSPELVLDAILQNPTTVIKKCFFSAKNYTTPRDNSVEYEVFCELWEQSKTACGKQDGCVTAEKFMWTVCNALEYGFIAERNSPSENIKHLIVKNLKYVFDFYEINPNILKEILTDHLRGDKGVPEDVEIMGTIIKEVKKLTEENRVQYISAEMVLDFIFDSPLQRHQELFKFHDKINKDKINDDEFLSDEEIEELYTSIDEEIKEWEETLDNEIEEYSND